jgi:hypothetical protein
MEKMFTSDLPEIWQAFTQHPSFLFGQRDMRKFSAHFEEEEEEDAETVQEEREDDECEVATMLGKRKASLGPQSPTRQNQWQRPSKFAKYPQQHPNTWNEIDLQNMLNSMDWNSFDVNQIRP